MLSIKNSKIILLCIFFMIMSFYTATKLDYMNSDNAIFAIAGKAIAEGNILLKDWVSSTFSFYFPILPMEAFWAIFIKDYQTIHTFSLINTTLIFFIVLYFLIQGIIEKKPNIFAIMSVAAIFIAGTPSRLSTQYSHFAPIIIILIVTYLYYFKKNLTSLTKIAIITLLALWCDNYDYIYFLFPLIIENMWNYLKTKKIDKRMIYIAIGMSAHFTLLYLKNYFSDFVLHVPGKNLEQAYIFINYNNIGQRLDSLYMYLSNMYSANFWGQNIFKCIPQIIFTGALFLSLYLHFAKGKEVFMNNTNIHAKNRFLTFILISSGIVFFINVLSVIGGDRYNIGLFINCLILLTLWLCENRYVHNHGFLVFFLFFSLSLLSQFNQSHYKMNWALKERRDIAKIIEQEHLHGGYAWFGNALSTNFVLNKFVIAPLYQKSTYPYFWLVDKNVFYQKKFDFLLVWKQEDVGKPEDEGREKEWMEYDWNDEEVQKNFGVPKKTIDKGRVRIYIFDDITNKVVKHG